MLNVITNAALLSAALATFAAASPTPALAPRNLTKRFEHGVDCDDSGVISEVGWVWASAGDGSAVACSDINENLVSDQANAVYCKTIDEDHVSRFIACPGDPAPSVFPDGSDAGEAANGVVQAFCAAAMGGNPAAESFILSGCLLWASYASNATPIEKEQSGALALCDGVLLGLCTWFKDVSPSISAGMDRPCVDDPNSGACAFAGPGK